jgi:hypothetical protein
MPGELRYDLAHVKVPMNNKILEGSAIPGVYYEYPNCVKEHDMEAHSTPPFMLFKILIMQAPRAALQAEPSFLKRMLLLG